MRATSRSTCLEPRSQLAGLWLRFGVGKILSREILFQIPMGKPDAHDAAFSVDQLMAVLARTARQPVAIYCPRCPHWGPGRDEFRVLSPKPLHGLAGSMG